MAAGGEGALYLWGRLPAGCDDEAVLEWLIRKHGVCVIPGSACGAPGYIRVAYGNVDAAGCQKAAARLRAGLSELAERGMDALEAWQQAQAAPAAVAVPAKP